MRYEPLKSESLEAEIFKWRTAGNIQTAMTQYANMLFPQIFRQWIAKGVMYLKNKKSWKFEQFLKTYSKKTIKIIALNIALFLS